MNKPSSQDLTQIALSTAFLTIASLLVLPIGPVPITLQVFIFLIIPALLGPIKSMSVIIVYGLAGLIGMPVFAGGIGGLSSLASPSFGYVLGAIPLSLFVGKALLKNRKKFKTILIMSIGLLFLYASGITYQYILMNTFLQTPITLNSIIRVNVLVFLPLDSLKIVFAALLYHRIRDYSFARRLTKY